MTDDRERRAGAYARQAMNLLESSVNREATLLHLFRRAMDEARQEARDAAPPAPDPVGSFPAGYVVTPRELASLCGMTKDTAYQRLARAARAGWVDHERTGVYRVTKIGASHFAFATLTRGRYHRAASVNVGSVTDAR